MNTLKKVRVIKAFEGWSVGAEFTPNALYRDHLVAAGFVEIVNADPIVNAQGAKPPAEPRRRGRPRSK